MEHIFLHQKNIHPSMFLSAIFRYGGDILFINSEQIHLCRFDIS
jgi:hypothetical protein